MSMTPPVEKERAQPDPFEFAQRLNDVADRRFPISSQSSMVSILLEFKEQILASRTELSKAEQSEWTHEPPTAPGWYWKRLRARLNQPFTQPPHPWEQLKENIGRVTANEWCQYWPVPIDQPGTQRALAEQREAVEPLIYALRSCRALALKMRHIGPWKEVEGFVTDAMGKSSILRDALSPTNGRTQESHE